MSFTFDLVYEPWIPCVDQEGTVIELGLLDTLRYAHQVREIADTSPLVTAALHRLHLAILHRVFGPKNWKAWAELWQLGYWPEDRLQSYFDQWHDRFDLFHPEHPFYQAAEKRVNPRPVFNLVHSVENNPTLFDHITTADGVALLPAEAARLLVAAQAFHTSGTRDPSQKLMFSNSPCTRGVVFIAQGDSLFHTLALNLFRYPDESVWYFDAEDEDRPAWELDEPPVKRSIPFGYLDYLTWQSLNIKLLPEEFQGQVVVREILDAPGLRFDSNEGRYLDPMMLYQEVGKEDQKRWRPLQFAEDRALWRDMNTLLTLNAQTVHPPYSLSWIGQLIRHGYLSDLLPYRYMALGMASREAKVFFYRHEHMPLRTEYLADPSLVAQLDTALGLAEEVSKKLRGSIFRLSELLISPTADQEGGHKPDPADTRNLADHLDVMHRYWGELEPLFWQFIDRLPAQLETAVDEWRESLRATAWRAFGAAEELAGTDPVSIKATVKARGQLGGGLKKVLN